MNINSVMTNSVQLKELYAAQATNESKKVERPPAGYENEPAEMKNRDSVTISQEARRLQRSSRAMASNESSIDQHKEIIIPGKDVTLIQPEAGLEPPRDRESKVQEAPPVALEPDVEEFTEQVPAPVMQSAAPANTDTAPARQDKAESDPVNEKLQDNSVVETNVNNVNNSSLVQAYAAAANVTQASMTVNYKV